MKFLKSSNALLLEMSYILKSFFRVAKRESPMDACKLLITVLKFFLANNTWQMTSYRIEYSLGHFFCFACSSRDMHMLNIKSLLFKKSRLLPTGQSTMWISFLPLNHLFFASITDLTHLRVFNIFKAAECRSRRQITVANNSRSWTKRSAQFLIAGNTETLPTTAFAAIPHYLIKFDVKSWKINWMSFEKTKHFGTRRLECPTPLQFITTAITMLLPKTMLSRIRNILDGSSIFSDKILPVA